MSVPKDLRIRYQRETGNTKPEKLSAIIELLESNLDLTPNQNHAVYEYIEWLEDLIELLPTSISATHILKYQ